MQQNEACTTIVDARLEHALLWVPFVGFYHVQF